MGKESRKPTRAERRAYKRFTEGLQSKFNQLATSFVQEYMNIVVKGYESEKQEQKIGDLFEKANRVWVSYVSWLIRKFNYKPDTKEMGDLKLRFAEWVNKFIDGQTLTVENLEVEEGKEEVFNKALNEIGVKTQAKTSKGLQKIIDQLNKEQEAQLREVLQG